MNECKREEFALKIGFDLKFFSEKLIIIENGIIKNVEYLIIVVSLSNSHLRLFRK